MELKLYKTNSSNNEINKILTDELIFDIRLKKRTDIYSPDIPINSDIDLTEYNYARIEQFDRSYFIEEIEPKPNKIYRLRLRVDVIESFKDDILNADSRITGSQELDYTNQSVDSDIRKETDKITGDYILENKNTFIMTTLGG